MIVKILLSFKLELEYHPRPRSNILFNSLTIIIINHLKSKAIHYSDFRLREEKKFAVKVQRSREDRKRKEKKKLLDATKKHRKGMKGQLEDMLKNAKRMQRDEEVENQTIL